MQAAYLNLCASCLAAKVQASYVQADKCLAAKPWAENVKCLVGETNMKILLAYLETDNNSEIVPAPGFIL